MPKPDVGAGLVVDYAGATTESPVGRPVPRLTIVAQDESRLSLDDAMGPDFALTAVDVKSEIDTVTDRIRELDPVTRCVRIGLHHGADYTPGDDEAHRWCQLHRGKIFLVRPDRYIAISVPHAGIVASIDKFLAATSLPKDEMDT